MNKAWMLPILVAPVVAAQPGPTPEPGSEPGPDLVARASDVEIGVKGAIMFRYTVSSAPGADDPDDDPSIGFQLRRLRTIFEASAYDGLVSAYIQLDGSENVGELVDAYMTYAPEGNWRFRFGQFRLNFNREMSISSSRQLTADRGSVANNLNPGASARLQGIEARYSEGPDRVFFTLSEGLDSELDDSAFNVVESGWGVTLRYERLLIGESFDPLSALTAPYGTPRALMLGLAGHAQHLDTEGDRYAWTADLSYEHDGFTAMVMGGGHVAEDRNRGANPEPESLYAVSASVGQYVTESVELFTRYEWGTTSDGDHPDLNWVTTGVNWYIFGQALKWTSDFSVAFDGVGPAFDRGTDGLLRTPDGENRYIFRTQFQLLF